MPELPEVETIARYLRQGTADSPGLLGRRAAATHLLWPRSLESPSEAVLQARLPGQVLQAIDRRGKFLMLHFTADTLLIHLRMSGEITISNFEIGNSKSEIHHVRFILDFEDGVQMVFVDPRKFGRIWLARDPLEVVGNLGPEPLDPGLTAEGFFRMLSSRRRLLKPLLLDQTFLAGLGNIYADESLNLARLHPCQPAQLLPYDGAERLLAAIRSVLSQAIEHQGATIDWVYKGGNFQNYFRAYQRTGEPCQNCGALIERIVVGQRGTHYCPNCQLIVN